MLIKKETMEGIENGVYQGVCVAVIDLGTQLNTYFNKKEKKMLIMWELPTLLITFQKDGVDITMPRVISKQYTQSFAEKAILLKDLQSWRGRNFTAEELGGFEVNNLIGVNCMIQVMNNTKDGKTYAKVANVLPLYQGVPEVKPAMNPIMYSVADDEIPENIPNWIKSLILKSDEKQKEGHIVDGGEEPPPQDCPF